MKREILFRGKRLDNNEWSYGYFNRINDKCYIFPEDATDSFDNYEVDPVTVGQSLDLKDKNGNTLFDGDVYRDALGRQYVVEYSRDRAQFLAKNTQWTSVVFRTFDNAFSEIIGNIHDNPELWKGDMK